jgi:ABC-type uncharacterized transport system permease subunit
VTQPAGSAPVRDRFMRLLGRTWSVVALPLISILLAAVVGSVVIIVSELLAQRPLDLSLPASAYSALVRGALGSPDALIRTLVSSTPLVFGGLAVGLAFRAGLFNIGAQGQFLVGALGAVWVGAMLREAPPVIALPVALAAGMLAGAAWGFIPGFLKATSGAHEVVTTIMLNYTATSFIAWAVSGPLRRNVASASPITTDVGNASLPILIGRTGHAGILLAVVAVVVVWWLLFKTTRGFEIRTVGANPDAARYAGMRPRFITVLAMAMAGGLAGLAGTSVLLGVTKSMTASFGTTVGFDSIAVALLGRSDPIGIVFAALLFGAMRAGAPLMQIEAGIPVELIDVLQATILLFLVANVVIRRAVRLADVSTGLGTTDTLTKTYGREAVAR